MGGPLRNTFRWRNPVYSTQTLIQNVPKYLHMTPKLPWLTHPPNLKKKHPSQHSAITRPYYSFSWKETHSASTPSYNYYYNTLKIVKFKKRNDTVFNNISTVGLSSSSDV